MLHVNMGPSTRTNMLQIGQNHDFTNCLTSCGLAEICRAPTTLNVQAKTHMNSFDCNVFAYGSLRNPLVCLWWLRVTRACRAYGGTRPQDDCSCSQTCIQHVPKQELTSPTLLIWMVIAYSSLRTPRFAFGNLVYATL